MHLPCFFNVFPRYALAETAQKFSDFKIPYGGVL